MIVIRYEGPKGGPGMPEMLTPTSAIMGAGLGKASPGPAGAFPSYSASGFEAPEVLVSNPWRGIRRLSAPPPTLGSDCTGGHTHTIDSLRLLRRQVVTPRGVCFSTAGCGADHGRSVQRRQPRLCHWPRGARGPGGRPPRPGGASVLSFLRPNPRRTLTQWPVWKLCQFRAPCSHVCIISSISKHRPSRICA